VNGIIDRIRILPKKEGEYTPTMIFYFADVNRETFTQSLEQLERRSK